jgi:hypothetical protein
MAPPEGSLSPLERRMEFIYNLSQVLTAEQRAIVADRLEAGPPKGAQPPKN